MTTLQQANKISLVPPVEKSTISSSSPESTGSFRLLSVHRRSDTILYLHVIPPDSSIEDDKGKIKLVAYQHLTPTPVGVYLLATDIAAEKQILHATPFEQYDSFVVLINAPNCRKALFFDLNMHLVTNCNLYYVHDQITHDVPTLSCGDLDQKRKDLVVATTTGRLYSFACRLVTQIPNGGVGKKLGPINTFQAIQRGKAKVDSTLGKMARQICTHDVNSTFLILYDTGDIQCCESSNLEPLWTVRNTCFRDPPTKIWGDKFGCYFMVYCGSSTGDHHGTLELWLPPETYNLCMSGHFFRALIGIECDEYNGGLKGVCIESIDEKNAHILVAQGNRQLQLWLIKKSDIQLAASMKLEIDSTTPIGQSPNLNITFKAPSHSVRSNISIMISSSADVTEVALHYPGQSDKIWMSAARTLEEEYAFSAMYDTNRHMISNRNGNDTAENLLKQAAREEKLALRRAAKAKAAKSLSVSQEKKGKRSQEKSKEESENSNKEMPRKSFDDEESIKDEMPPPTREMDDSTFGGASADDESVDSVLSSVYDPNTVRRPPSPEWLDEDVSNDLLDHFNRQDAASALGSGKPPKVMHFIPNALGNNSIGESSGTVELFDAEGYTSITVPSAMYIQSDSDNVSCLRLVSRQGLAPVDSSTKAAAVVIVDQVGIAVMAMTMTIITTLKESFVYTIDPELTMQRVPPLRCEMPLDPHGDVTAICCADVLCTTYITPSSGSRKHKDKVIREFNKVGKYSLTLVGESTGQLIYTITTKDELFQCKSTKIHNSAVAALTCTANATRPTWRLRLEEVEMMGVEGMRRPMGYPGSAIISVSTDGEVKILQPVFTSLNKGVDVTKEEQVFIVFEVTWRISGLYTINEPNMSVSSAVVDPTCMSALFGYKDNGSLRMYPISGVVDVGDGRIGTCREYDWEENRIHGSGILSIHVYCASNGGCMNVVDMQDTADSPGITALYKPVGVKGTNINKWSCGYTLRQLTDMTMGSSMVSCGSDGTLVLWRFQISSIVCGDRGRLIFPIACKSLQFSSPPSLGVATLMPDNSWALRVLVSGVVLTALRGVREELFSSTIDDHHVTTKNSLITEDPHVIEPMPVVCSIKKALEVAEIMPMRQEAGIYSWQSLAKWAAPPLPNEGPPEVFYMDDDTGLEYRLDTDLGDEIDPKPMTGVDERPPTAYLRIEFEDEIEMEICRDNSSKMLNGVYVRPRPDKPLEVMAQEFNPRRYTVNGVQNPVMDDEDADPLNGELSIIDDSYVSPTTASQVHFENVTLDMDNEVLDDESAGSTISPVVIPRVKGIDPLNKEKAKTHFGDGPLMNPHEKVVRNKEEYTFDLTLSPSIHGISANSLIESKRAITVVVDKEDGSDAAEKGAPRPEICDPQAGKYVGTKANNLRIQKTQDRMKAMAAVDAVRENQRSHKYVSKKVGLDKPMVRTKQPIHDVHDSKSSIVQDSKTYVYNAHGYDPQKDVHYSHETVHDPVLEDGTYTEQRTTIDVPKPDPLFAGQSTEDLDQRELSSIITEDDTAQPQLFYYDAHGYQPREAEAQPKYLDKEQHYGTRIRSAEELEKQAQWQQPSIDSSDRQKRQQFQPQHHDQSAENQHAHQQNQGSGSQPVIQGSQQKSQQQQQQQQLDAQQQMRSSPMSQDSNFPQKDQKLQSNQSKPSNQTKHHISLKTASRAVGVPMHGPLAMVAHVREPDPKVSVGKHRPQPVESTLKKSDAPRLNMKLSNTNSQKALAVPTASTTVPKTPKTQEESIAVPPQQKNNDAKPAQGSNAMSSFVLGGNTETSSELPHNYFDRSAKAFIVDRKVKNFAHKAKQYVTKALKSVNTEVVTDKVKVEEVVAEKEDWELFLTTKDDVVDKYMKLFVDIIKQERGAYPPHVTKEVEPQKFTMTTNKIYFLKLPEIIRGVMKRVVTMPELDDLFDEVYENIELSPEQKISKSTMVSNQPMSDDVQEEKRLQFKAFKELYIAIEDRIQERIAPPHVTHSVNKPGSKNIPVHVTVSRAASVVVLATDKPLTGTENFFDNFEYMKNMRDTVVAVEKVELNPQDKSEQSLVMTLVGYPFPLQKDTEYHIYCVASHDTSLTGRPSRYSNETIIEKVVTTTTLKTKEVFLDIEWSAMSPDQQVMEVRAGLRDLAVQAEIQMNKKVVPPEEADLQVMNDPTGRSNLKKYNDYVLWWTGGDTSGAGYSALRLDFLRRECLYAAKLDDGALINAASDDGRMSTEEAKELIENMQDWEGSLPSELRLESDEYCRYRLWYTGGHKQKIPNKFQVEENEEEEEEPNEEEVERRQEHKSQRLEARSKFLQERITQVDNRVSIAKSLIKKHIQATDRGLAPEDLDLKLFDLTDDDLECLMPSILVRKLCAEHKVDLNAFKKGRLLPAQAVSGEDMFVVMPEDHLIPDAPPILEPMCLPGTNRRPLKPWFRCSEEEKKLEVKMACALDCILELAVYDLICMPDIEDAGIPERLHPMRYERYQKFAEWYAGDEGVCKIKGKGIPSLARVTFAEKFEAQHAVRDPYFVNTLDLWSPEEMERALAEVEEEERTEKEKEKEKGNARFPWFNKSKYLEGIEGIQMDEDKKRILGKLPPECDPATYKPTSYFANYEELILAPEGVKSRLAMLQWQFDQVIQARQFTMNKLLWPGFGRLHKMFMFPHCPMQVPKVVFPAKRYKLWPSKSKTSYFMKDILSWYEPKQLDRDDSLLRKAESLGQKKAAYAEWLMHEDERRAEGRILMLNEDRESHIIREYWHYLGSDQDNWKLYEDKTFAFSTPLPKNFDFIRENTQHFVDGSGVENEDEIKDMHAEALRMQQKAVDDFIEAKKQRLAAKRKKEEDEQKRKQREEMDRRMAETVEKRRALRIHLNHVKAERAKAEEDRLLQIQREAEQAKLDAEAEARREVERQKLLKQEAELEEERSRMLNEEMRQREVNNRIREIRSMEHEDICSFIMRHLDKQEEEDQAKHLKELEDLYEPFVPFDFKHERTESLYSDSLKVETYLSQEDFSAKLEEKLNAKFMDQQRELEQEQTSLSMGESSDFRLKLSIEEGNIGDASGSHVHEFNERDKIDISKNAKETFTFTPSVSEQIQQNAGLDPQSLEIKGDKDLKPVRFKKSSIGWKGLSNKIERGIKNYIDNRRYSHHLRNEILGQDVDLMNRLRVENIEPTRISSAKLTRKETGLPRDVINSMNNLSLIQQIDLEVKELKSKSFSQSAHGERSKSNDVGRSESPIDHRSVLSSSLKSSYTKADNELHDMSSEVYVASDISSQEVLVNKNAHTLASLSSMGHQPGKREHNVAQSVKSMQQKRNMIHEYMGSEYLLQEKRMKPFYGATLQTNEDGVKIREKGYLEENFDASTFSQGLEELSRSNPLLGMELEDTGASRMDPPSTCQENPVASDNTTEQEPQLIKVNVGITDDLENHEDIPLSPGALHSSSLYMNHNMTDAEMSRDNHIGELGLEEPFIDNFSPNKDQNTRGKRNNAKSKNKKKRKETASSKKKNFPKYGDFTGNGMERESLESVTSEGERYRPPFYHPSLHFYGNKINISEHDPKLAKYKQAREESAKASEGIKTAQPSVASSSIPAPPIIQDVYENPFEKFDIDLISQNALSLADTDDCSDQVLEEEPSFLSINNSKASSGSIPLRVEVKRVEKPNKSPDSSPKLDKSHRKSLAKSKTLSTQTPTLPPIAGVKIDNHGPGKDLSFRAQN